MIVDARSAEPFYKNGFLVTCERTHEAVLIDPGDEIEELIALARDRKSNVRFILLTHAHLDHVTGVGQAKAAFGAPVYLHADDQFLYDAVPQQGRMFGLNLQQPPPVDAYYSGSSFTFGDYDVRVHHTPGHCPGGVCLQIGKTGDAGGELFPGDTLFAGGIGRTDLPGGDYNTLMRSITEVLFSLGDDSVVHPGHGPDTTIRRERETNPFVLQYYAGR